MCRGTRAGRNGLVPQIPTFPAPHSHFKLILKISGVYSAGCDTGGASVRVSPSRQNGTSQNRDISVQTLSPVRCGQGKGSVISPMWDRAPNQAVPAPLPEHSLLGTAGTQDTAMDVQQSRERAAERRTCSSLGSSQENPHPGLSRASLHPKAGADI